MGVKDRVRVALVLPSPATPPQLSVAKGEKEMVAVPLPLSVIEVDEEAQMVTLTVTEGELEVDSEPPIPPPPTAAPCSGVPVAAPGEGVEDREEEMVEGKDSVPEPPVGVPPTLPPPKLALTDVVYDRAGEEVWEAVADAEVVVVKDKGEGELDGVGPPPPPPPPASPAVVPVGLPLVTLWVGEEVIDAEILREPVALGDTSPLLLPPAREYVMEPLDPGVRV